MKMRFRKALLGQALLITALAPVVAVAADENITCPTLTANDITNVIDKGVIATNQGYTLADEANKPADQVIRDEPTANPFDTFYQMIQFKKIESTNYFIYIGNILGKESYEAKDRAKKILLSSEQNFVGRYDKENKVCFYKEINASQTNANYPFKSSFETMVLFAMPMSDSCSNGSCKNLRLVPQFIK